MGIFPEKTNEKVENGIPFARECTVSRIWPRPAPGVIESSSSGHPQIPTPDGNSDPKKPLRGEKFY